MRIIRLMKNNKKINNLIIIFIVVFFIFILLLLFNKIRNNLIKNNLVEKFNNTLKPTIVKNIGIPPTKPVVKNSCAIPKVNNVGDKNFTKVLSDYPAQSDIHTSGCENYWKKLPAEYNNELIKTEPYLLFDDQLVLPKEKQFGNNQYVRGLINFKKLATIINDRGKDKNNGYNKNEIDKAEELIIDPQTKVDLGFRYKLEFAYEILNKTTWVNRWQKYNPTVKMTFIYDEIKSQINDINILNIEFKKRIDKRQREILSENELLLFGLIPFQILKYKILYIHYINKNVNAPLYIIEISFFRDQDLYINTFAYKGYIDRKKQPHIVDAEYIGKNATDNFLLPEFYNDGLLTQEIINKNFSNMGEMEKDPSAIADAQKAQQEAFKIKNNYACFNINYNPSDPKSEYILQLYSRIECESMYDPYGKSKNVGIFDAPCKTNEECPFYKKNGNYDNDFGKCMKDGQCQLPSNMQKLGYHYFLDIPSNKPLCYNCDSNKLRPLSAPNTCCDEQDNKKKYPYLKTPDYVFDDDYLARKNFFNKMNCNTNGVDELDLRCLENP